jgi:hypothetical protein
MPREHKYTPEEWLRAGERRHSGRRAEGLRSARPGYPALFNGLSSATKLLAEIAALEPAHTFMLPERQLLSQGAVNVTTRRLEAQGLVRRFRPLKRPGDRLALDRRHPYWRPIRTLLMAIAQSNNLAFPDEPPKLPTKREAKEFFASTRAKKIFGEEPDPVYTLFGRPGRTLAILGVATIGVMDMSSLGRLIEYNTRGGIMQATRPIVADGVFVSEDVGNLVVLSLPEAPWADGLRGLAAAICERDRRLAGDLQAARDQMVGGVFRAPMKRRLEQYEAARRNAPLPRVQ